jgi:hypothetical protein
MVTGARRSGQNPDTFWAPVRSSRIRFALHTAEPMSHYVEFPATTDGHVLVEVDGSEVAPLDGVQKAGLGASAAGGAVVRAQSTFEEAVKSAIVRSVAALGDAVEALPVKATAVELTFALKATGELGNIAIAKASSEANFTVRLTWTPEMP